MASGLLLVNLGSPAEPTRKAVYAYLTEFLTDPYVIDLPFPLRQLLVRAIIAPFRSGRSAKLYRSIWTEEGSPLVTHTRDLARAVQAELGEGWSVRWAMRYGRPSIRSVFCDWPVTRICLVPLYPQYAESSTRSSIEKVKQELFSSGARPPLSVLEDFHVEPEFVGSEIHQIQDAVRQFKPDHVLLSFHGLPESHLRRQYPATCLRTDDCCERVMTANRFCYRSQCFATARAIREGLDFPVERVSVGFQSRLGRQPWIKPYSDEEVSRLAARGIKKLLVSCPAFVADCLETLEEVQIRLRDQFVSQGGAELRLVPALNSDPAWAVSFAQLILRKFSFRDGASVGQVRS